MIIEMKNNDLRNIVQRNVNIFIRKEGKRSKVQASTFRARDRDKIEDPKSS